MPTENRSSNTEQIVSVPRSLLEEACNGLRITQERARKELRALLAQPAAQHQGEPVAWRGINELGEVVTEWIDGVPPERMVDLRGNPGSFAKIELAYSHVDAGEVEQGYPNSVVEGLVNRQNELREERDTLRAQLAERVAALDALTEIATGYKRDLYAAHALLRDVLENRHLTPGWNQRMKAVLSASAEPIPFPGYPPVPEDRKLPAEPSAPVERDERADFEADQLSKGFAIDLLPGTVATYMIPAVRFAWAGWQARAALERKP